MTNRTYTIGKDIFQGTKSISRVHGCAKYRYVRACVRIQRTVELGVKRRYNVEDVRTNESLIHVSTMKLHNRRTLKLLRHALSFLMTLHNTRSLKAFGNAPELSIWFYVQVLEIH